MDTQIIPCEDCEAAKRRFERARFRVLGCSPHPTQADMCVISFELIEDDEPPPRAAPAPAPTLAERGGAAAAPAGTPAPTTAAAPAGAEALTATAAPPAAAGGVASSSGPITPTQARTAQAIVNIFETSEVLGDYGQVTLLKDDPGRLTYGRSQTTLGSGLLARLLQRYCDNAGARFARRLRPWLPAVIAEEAQVDTALPLHNLLRACADDPVMREIQDAFFDEEYWRPALAAAQRLGLTAPLSVAVVYDGHVHGSWGLLRDRTREAVGEPSAAGERRWIAAYVKARREWLATHRLAILRNTVYRMDAFQRLIDQSFWGLALPLVVRGSEISNATLGAMPPRCYDGPQPGSRPLGLQEPLLRGLDVRLVQLALSDNGADIKADGVFGQASVRGIKALQIARGLPVTGLVDVALIGDLVR